MVGVSVMQLPATQFDTFLTDFSNWKLNNVTFESCRIQWSMSVFGAEGKG